ncbi:hypothetical protein [Rhodococcoides fascians]|uniref:hypothetical protein n=1 Tax=Rhodococcoides fascians TaxID=1828 RepID=UPI0037B98B11
MNDRMHTPDWEELEMWIASFDAAPNPASVVQAMKNSGWRPPAQLVSTPEQLQDLKIATVLVEEGCSPTYSDVIVVSEHFHDGKPLIQCKSGLLTATDVFTELNVETFIVLNGDESKVLG